jgi:hypothetical protein
MEYTKLLEEYSSKTYSLYSNSISEHEWGNRQIANEYLDKYYLSEQYYLEKWKVIQNSIFVNQEKGLPEIMFNESFSILINRGGILFTKQDFENLQNCLKKMGEKNLIIIQNDFGVRSDIPPFRMIYPVDITWENLMSGNFISTALFEMFANDYFVFGESGKWGKYSANDCDYPLDIIGFHPEFKPIFFKYFSQNDEEKQEIEEWLPDKYKKLIG